MTCQRCEPAWTAGPWEAAALYKEDNASHGAIEPKGPSAVARRARGAASLAHARPQLLFHRCVPRCPLALHPLQIPCDPKLLLPPYSKEDIAAFKLTEAGGAGALRLALVRCRSFAVEANFCCWQVLRPTQARDAVAPGAGGSS